MTAYYPRAVPPQAGGPLAPFTAQAGLSTADVVRDQAADAGHSSVEAGNHAAEVASQQASGVVAEAGRPGRDLLRQAHGQLTAQAAHGQHRAASAVTVQDESVSSAQAVRDQALAARDAVSDSRH